MPRECELQLNERIDYHESIVGGQIVNAETRVNAEFVCYAENCPRNNRTLYAQKSGRTIRDISTSKGQMSNLYGNLIAECDELRP